MQDNNYFAVGTPFTLYGFQGPVFTFDILHSYYTIVEADLYVAPWGDDENSGLTPYEPLQRIAYAMHLITSDSTNHHTVYCASGLYSKSLNNQQFPIGLKRFVTLEGEAEATTIFDNEMNPRGFVQTHAYARYSTVRNFAWRNMFSNYQCPVIFVSNISTGGPILFEDIKIENCTSLEYTGINVALRSDNITLRNISMDNITCLDGWNGIYLQESFAKHPQKNSFRRKKAGQSNAKPL